MHSVAEIPGLIAEDNADAFYSWPEWRRLKAEVLRLDHFECQECRKICAVIDEAGLSVAGVAENGELHMQGNFYDVKLFEVVE